MAKTLFGLIGLLLLITGCSTLSEEQCRLGDWQAVGYQDGVNGRDPMYLSKHLDACTDYGISPDKKAYSLGRDEGLKQFCTYDNGLSFGKSNRGYANVCPAELAKDFLRGYEKGKKVAKVQEEIYQVSSDIRTLEDQMDKEQDLGRKVSMRTQIRMLQRQQERLNDEAREIEAGA